MPSPLSAGPADPLARQAAPSPRQEGKAAEKARLRQSIRQARLSLSRRDRADLSAQTCKILTPVAAQSRFVGVYRAQSGEMSLEPLIAKLQKRQGKTLLYEPVTLPRDRRMLFVLAEPAAPWASAPLARAASRPRAASKTAPQKILRKALEARRSKRLARLARGRRGAKAKLAARRIENLTLVLVPMLAVDRQGRRLGQGGGYYDASLARRRPGLPNLLATGFPIQLVASVPSDSRDARVDAFADARGILRLGQAAQRPDAPGE